MHILVGREDTVFHIPEQGTTAKDFVGGDLGKRPGRSEGPYGCDDVGPWKMWMEECLQGQWGWLVTAGLH